jgi:2',3'-cyclic-nucleotide 2'-phosphodiesterase (5'-nucleotidase family)
MRNLLRIALLAAFAGCQTMGPGGAAGVATEPFDIVVLSTTDVHGRVKAWDYYGDSAESGRGLSRAATIVDSVRAANPGNVVLLDAGDLLQGNPFTYIAMKQFSDSANPIIAAMNAMGYDAMAIGNHEYNYGVPYLERAVAQAKFPMLSANTYKPDGTHKFKPWTIIDRRGVKIGVVGATTPGVMVWDASNVSGKVQLGDIVTAVRKAVDEVRAAGADVIVVTTHSGLDEPASYDTVSTGLPGENVSARLAREIPGIDLIVYGHSHKEQKDLHIGSTLLVQPKNWATSVGVARLSLSRDGGKWKVTSSKGETIQARGHAENPAVLAAAAATHAATVKYVTSVAGSTPVAWRGDSVRLKDTPLVDFILEVQRKATGADLASTAAFTLDAKLDSGAITVAEIAQLYPYDNTLRAIRITGKQLREYLDFSSRYYTRVENGKPETDPTIPGYNFDMLAGADYTIDLTKPLGSRVTSLSFKGKPVTDTDTFTLALNNYRQTGGGGFAMLKDAPVVYDKQEELRQLLIDEVERRKLIRPDDYFRQNWRLVYPGAASVAGEGAVLAPGAPRLRIIATTDFHGALETRTDGDGVRRGGAAIVAAVIEQARNECKPACETLLVDGGDLFQGSLISNLAFGRPVVEYYNRMGYTAAAVGNHEFDWGQDSLKARMREAKFAFLGANVRLPDGKDAPWIRDDTLVAIGNIKVGIIGIASVETRRTSFEWNVRGLRFDTAAVIVDEHARRLRARGADAIVVIAHEGGTCGASACSGEVFDMARQVTERIDAIVAGHRHFAIDTEVNGIPIVMARTRGQAVGVIDIPLTNGRVSGRGVGELRAALESEFTPVPAIDSIVRRAASTLGPMVNRRIARLAEPLERDGGQYPLGNLIADAHRAAGKGDVGITNNGGIRTNVPAAWLTYRVLYDLQPFGNQLFRVRMSGTQLKAYLEQVVAREPELREHVSGITIAYDPSRPKGQRIVSLRLPAGRTISDSATYTVIMNEFMAAAGEGVAVPAGIEKTGIGISDLDALVAYLEKMRDPIIVPHDDRIVVTQ